MSPFQRTPFPHLVLLVTLLGAAAGASARGDAVPLVFRYRTLEIAGWLPKAEVSARLQAFVYESFGKGFRYLGEEGDFDHGHVLISRAGLPFAILYHTQEGASSATPGSRYDYLDSAKRNWIQFLPSGEIERADAYQWDDVATSPDWANFRAAFTVIDAMLDPLKMGTEEVREFQLTFRRYDCADYPYARSYGIGVGLLSEGDEDNAIELSTPDEPRVCLALSGWSVPHE